MFANFERMRRELDALFGDLPGGHIAESDVPDQTLALKLGQHAERGFDGTFGRTVGVEHGPQIDYVQHVAAQVAQVVVDGAGQHVGRQGGHP